MIIQSILDDDLYKFTMQRAIYKLYPEAYATYEFTNRRPSNTFDQTFAARLNNEIDNLKELELNESEFVFLGKTGLFDLSYLSYLRHYRYNPSEVDAYVSDGELKLHISGPWHRTVLWEVKLMAIISELYFQDCKWNTAAYSSLSNQKGRRLADAGCKFSDFGTRRRRSFESQLILNEAFQDIDRDKYLGTSNVHLARILNVNPIGTMAHEFIMGMSILHGLRHANRFAMQEWAKVYKGKLGIALTDTYGTDAFLKDFDGYFARLWDGVRQDSGFPLIFADKVEKHFKKLGIDPWSKKIVFSDSLTTDSAIEINEQCPMPCQFGIGTHFTNDFPEKALNMVIKLNSLNHIPVVKLSDDPGKASGNKQAIRVAKWTFLNQSLDN